MSENIKPPELLKFTARAASGHLEVVAENISGKILNEQLLVGVKLPAILVNSDIRAAVERSATNQKTKNMESLSGVVAVDGGWSIWAYNGSQKHLSYVHAYNYLDQRDGKAVTTPTKLEAGARLTFRIPLPQQDLRAQVMIPYSYQYGGRKGKTIDGEVELITAGAGECKPTVSLKAEHTSPTAIPFGQSVTITWNITGGVSAVLRGPLSGGHSELRLSDDERSPFWIQNGSVEVYAVGTATYLLDAEVCGPEGQPNVQVVRTLMLDTNSVGKYANLLVRPGRVLPNGEVELDWAVWGVDKAKITLGNRSSLNLALTEQDFSRTFHGTGIWRVNAAKANEKVSLTVKNDVHRTATVNTDLIVVEWVKIATRGFTGKPVAMAVAAPTMALLTADGLWLTTVKRDDSDGTALNEKVFSKISKDAPKARLALTVLDKGYVVLQQTDGDGLQLARYQNGGASQGVPIDLPDTFKSIARQPDSVYDLAALGNRVYVAAQNCGGSQCLSVSVRFDQNEQPRREPWVERLPNYRLLTFHGGLYAIHRSSGQMLRFDLKENGELDRPRKAASATFKGQSLIRKGLLIPVGAVLADLEPEPFQEFREMRLSELMNPTEDVLEDEGEEKKEGAQTWQETPQDLVYNPQTDEWTPCGNGLRIKPGAVAAYRGGASERMWVLQPDGELFTLMSASEDLFAQDFVEKFPSEPLPPALDSVQEFTLVNETGINFSPVDDHCRAAGLDSFSATSIAELEMPPGKFPQNDRKTFTLRYNQNEPGLMWLRFLAEGSGSHRYILELTFSGRGLSSIKSVIKRLTDDRQIAEVPTTSAQHAPDRPIVVPRAARLLNKSKLFIVNSTHQDLSLAYYPGNQEIVDSRAAEFDFTTPSFRIFAPQVERVGWLWVNFDFAMPPGIEMSPGNEPQRNLIRINTDNRDMLDVAVKAWGAGEQRTSFPRYDETATGLTKGIYELAYICRVGIKTKQELDGVRLGDGVVSPDGKLMYIPLAYRERLPNAQVLRSSVGEFSHPGWPAEAKDGVFAMPNSVAASNDKVYASFGDTFFQERDRYLHGLWKKTSLTGYRQIVALTATANGDVYMVATKDKYIDYQLSAGYYLVAERPPRARVELSIDNKLSFPVVGPPIAISPDGKTLAICQQGGLLVVDVQGDNIKTENIQKVTLSSAREPAYVTFSRDGAWIYCAHMTRALNFNPRRTVAGRDLTVSRVRVGNLTETTTRSLPDVQSKFGLTGNTRQSFPVATHFKEEAAFSLAVSPDNRALFVSAGAAILKIDTSTFDLMQWRKDMELPCRLIYVAEGRGNAWTVYALGSYYVGNGTTVDEYKTHLYAIPALKS